MKLRLYKEHGALNSPPIFAAFQQGIKNIGWETEQSSEAIPVIWSVLWSGRMRQNQHIYNFHRQRGTPVIIIEIGNLKRGNTWRISVNHVNNRGLFGNDVDCDPLRHEKLGVRLGEIKEKRKDAILVACQHQHSLQWEGQPPMRTWVQNTIAKLKKHTDRPIIVRPHPRSPFNIEERGITLEKPIKINHSYDDFNIDYGYHCVVNYNSGPAVQAAINGVPIICDASSLAWPVSGKIEEIEEISLPDRTEWFNKLCHTEWTLEEISQGIPLLRLEKYLR